MPIIRTDYPSNNDMANDEHVAMLKQGVAAWNAWRDKDPNIRPNLNYADLNGAELSGADLSFTHLQEADLRDANLSKSVCGTKP